jgi:hypothetical protein
LHLDLRRIDESAQKLWGGGEWGCILPDRAALVLGQPYHRINQAGFKTLLAGLAQHLRQTGCSRVFVNLHPSEGMEVFESYYRDLGFEIGCPDMNAPVESIMQALPATSTLVSFNSSALLNARKFGFRGEVIAYGLDWVAAQYPFQPSLYKLNSGLLEYAGVAIIPHFAHN